jgi:hypothetical protein
MGGHVAHRRWKLIDYRIDVDFDGERRETHATMLRFMYRGLHSCCQFVGWSLETNYLSNFGTLKDCLMILGKMKSCWEVR